MKEQREKEREDPRGPQVPGINAEPKVGHKGANEQLGFQSPHYWQGYMKKKGMEHLKETSFALTTCLKIEVA
jgi:hypothetical protein